MMGYMSQPILNKASIQCQPWCPSTDQHAAEKFPEDKNCYYYIPGDPFTDPAVAITQHPGDAEPTICAGVGEWEMEMTPAEAAKLISRLTAALERVAA